MVKLEQQAEEALKTGVEGAFRRAMEREASRQQFVPSDNVVPEFEFLSDPPISPAVQNKLGVLEIRQIVVDVQSEAGNGGSVVFMPQENAPLRVAIPTSSRTFWDAPPARSMKWVEFLGMLDNMVRGVQSAYGVPIGRIRTYYGDPLETPDEQGE